MHHNSTPFQIKKEAMKRVRKSRKQLEKQEKEKQQPAKDEPPLSLGVILRQLDGGSEAPGRMMVSILGQPDRNA